MGNPVIFKISFIKSRFCIEIRVVFASTVILERKNPKIYVTLLNFQFSALIFSF